MAVRDRSAFWLSSGNWNNSNQPDIDPVSVPADAQQARRRDRDWHVVVEQPQLAGVFEDYIRNDQQVAASNSVDYFSKVARTVGGAAIGQSIQLYMVPGMGHCAGGAGTAGRGAVPEPSIDRDSLDAQHNGLVVGRSLLQWSDNSVDIYVGDINENAPQCSAPCGRFFHQDGNYSGCPGGASHHYDHSLWLTAGFSG